MLRYFNDILMGLWSLIIGMGITFREFFKPKVTLLYPHQSVKMPARTATAPIGEPAS